MEFKEFGDQQNPKLLLIHGSASTWELNFGSIVEELSDDFFLILPLLNGHNPNRKKEFHSIEEEAKDIENYIIEQCNGKIDGAYGISFGGSILIQLLANNNISIGKAILDSAVCMPLGIFANLAAKAFASQIIKLENNKPLSPVMKIISGLDDHKIRKAYSDNTKTSYIPQIPYISPETIRKTILECTRFRIPARITATASEVTFWYGGKEPMAIKSARNLKKFLPDMTIKIFEDLGHGGLIMNPDRLISELRQELKQG